jgi:outer membrane cobalamin receptor
MPHRHRALVPVLAALLAACGSAPPAMPIRADRNLISAEEIERITASTAHDIVRQLRPEYLRSRGRISVQNERAAFAVVYVNGVRVGGLEQLHTIRAGDVEYIRYLNAADATTRWGTGHSGGVIEVLVKT